MKGRDMNTSFQSIDTAYRAVLRTILEQGEQVSPRGKPTLELQAARIVLQDPSANILADPGRRINYTFSVTEWLWMLAGQNDLEFLAWTNSRMRQFSDDGVTFAGAYGPAIVQQLPYVVNTLKEDPDSRQAVITVWERNPRPSKDIPCTTHLQFLLRKGKLNMITTMRSNDAWLGFPYDVFNMTQIQRYLASALDVDVGTYVHLPGSLHLYQNRWTDASQLLQITTILEPPRAPQPTYPLPNWVRAATNMLAAGHDPIHIMKGFIGSAYYPYIELLRRYMLKNAGHENLIIPEPWNRLFQLREDR